MACWVYLPPHDNNLFFEAFHEVLERIWLKRKNVLLVGDLNCDMLFKGKTNNQEALGKRLNRILQVQGLRNVIKKATRISKEIRNLIDVIVTSKSDSITASGVSHLGISDHSLVYANLRMRKTKQNKVTKTINNYKNVDANKFKAEFEAASWSVCEIFNDLEDQVWAWKRLFKNIASAHIPKRKVRTRTNSLPWLNLEIRKAQNKRYKLLKQYKENKDEETWQTYKQLRNKMQKMLKEAEMVYWRNQFDKASNCKEFGQVVKKVN